MRLLIIGCGGVGEVIAKVLAERSQKKDWLQALIVTDYDGDKVEQLKETLLLQEHCAIYGEKLDASSKEDISQVIQKYEVDCVLDASPPYLANTIFDAAFENNVHFLNMGTWSVPDTTVTDLRDGKKAYTEFMTDYNLNRFKQWEDIQRTAIICVGIDPGVVDVFSKYGAKHLFDEIKEVHVKDGCNIAAPHKSDTIDFGFNVWTVLDECLNTNITWNKEDGFVGHEPFSGEETFYFPEGVGPLTLYQIEHEEVVLMSKYLEEYGLEKCTYKIALDEQLVDALKVINKLGLRDLRPVTIHGKETTPRDVLASLLPQPAGIDGEYQGKMCVGVHCKGLKDGLEREVFIYQTYDQQEAWDKYKSQAIVTQTAIGASIAVELVGTGQWNKHGVFGPEAFEPEAFIKLMGEYDYNYGMMEMPSPYQHKISKEDMSLKVQ